MNLDYVLSHLKAHIPYLAMGGPTLFGELPRGQNKLDANFELYLGINSRYAKKYNITFLDTRYVPSIYLKLPLSSKIVQKKYNLTKVTVCNIQNTFFLSPAA